MPTVKLDCGNVMLCVIFVLSNMGLYHGRVIKISGLTIAQSLSLHYGFTIRGVGLTKLELSAESSCKSSLQNVKSLGLFVYPNIVPERCPGLALTTPGPLIIVFFSLHFVNYFWGRPGPGEFILRSLYGTVNVQMLI